MLEEPFYKRHEKRVHRWSVFHARKTKQTLNDRQDNHSRQHDYTFGALRIRGTQFNVK